MQQTAEDILRYHRGTGSGQQTDADQRYYNFNRRNLTDRGIIHKRRDVLARVWLYGFMLRTAMSIKAEHELRDMRIAGRIAGAHGAEQPVRKL